MKMLKWIPVIMAMIFFACNQGEKPATGPRESGPSVVEMRNVDGSYEFVKQ